MLQYTLTATNTGDLTLTQTKNDRIRSRVLLYLDTYRNERALLPGYGNTLTLFSPAIPIALQCEVLRLGLIQWAAGDDAEFRVQPIGFVTDERAKIQISWNGGAVEV